MIRVAITGPESTGKSILTRQLADHFNASWVPEYARDYISNLDRPYEEKDLLAIAKGQIEQENKLIANQPPLLFVDTELTVIKIWSEFKYGKCNPWIEREWQNQVYDLYLLMNIDLPWQDDPQREHPYARKELFDLYVKALKTKNAPFEVISGQGKERLNNALRVISEM